jgi:hypothetical protein
MTLLIFFYFHTNKLLMKKIVILIIYYIYEINNVMLFIWYFCRAAILKDNAFNKSKSL